MPVGLTTQNFGAFKTVYRDQWISAIKRHEGQFQKIPVITDVHAQQYQFPLELQGVTSLGNAVEGQAFPTPNAPIVTTSTIGYKVFHCAVQLTDVVRALAKGDKGSFRSASDSLIKSAVSQSMRYREFQHYLDGTNVVGVLTGTTTVATTTMSITPYDAVLASRATDRTSVNAGIWAGAAYDIVDQTTLLVKGSVVIAAQNEPTSSGTLGNFTLAAPGFPAATVAGDLLVWKDSFGLGYEGLSSLIDNDITSSYQGVNFAGQPLARSWVSTVLSNGGTLRTLTPSLFYRALQGGVDKMGQGVDGDGAFDASRLEVIANPAMAEQFSNIYMVTGSAANQGGGNNAQQGTVMYDANTKKFGNSALSLATPLGDITLKLRSNCPQSTIFGVDYSQLMFVQQRALDWREGQANMFNPSQVAANYTAQLYEVGQVGVKDRRGMFKILDVTYSTTNSGS